METKKPKISVIIPTYNRASVLLRAVNSVFCQTLQDFELIIIDDCSTDSTEQVIKGVCDVRIRYFKREKKENAAAARNVGIQCARAELVAFLDSDDEWLPRKLERQVALFKQAGLATAGVFSWMYLYPSRRRFSILLPTEKLSVYRQLLGKNILGSPSSAMIRKSCLEAVGFFDARLPSSEDYDLWLRLAKRYRIAVVNEPLVIIHAGGADRLSRNLEAKSAAAEIIDRKINGDLTVIQRRKRKAFQRSRFGYWYHLRGDSLRGRALVLRALRDYPFAGKVWLYYLAVLMPFRVWEKVRSCFRRYKPFE
jgi:glycosyltransferase involved in cell wall biosynthesis